MAVIAAAAQFHISGINGGKTARIYRNGELLHELTLSSDTDIMLESNTIQINGGKIGVVEADCPDKLCVKAGFINGAIPIVCLPNRVEVRIVSDKSLYDYDGITG